MNAAAIIPQDAIFYNNQQLLTSSIKVAEAFTKEHKNVTQKIRNLECSAQFLTANFSAVKFHHNGNEYEAFEITKDGFMFLVMGFTGKKAAAIKESFIEQFNTMAAQLQNQPPHFNQQPINPAQLHNLKHAARRQATKTGQPVLDLYETLMETFGVNDLRELTADLYPFACTMLGTDPIEGEWLRSSMPPQPKAPSYHYPKNSLRPTVVDMPHANRSWLTAHTLLEDCPKPLHNLLRQLESEGHNIEGPRLEYDALRKQLTHISQLASNLNELARNLRDFGLQVNW